jgi:hypothetical protein
VLVAENLFLVMTDPVEGQDDAFNEWYDTCHVREVLALPGTTSRKCKVREEDLPAPLPPASRSLFAVLIFDQKADFPSHGVELVIHFTDRVGCWICHREAPK